MMKTEEKDVERKSEMAERRKKGRTVGGKRMLAY